MCTGRCGPDYGLIPLFTGLIMGVGILTTYSIAVALEHVSPLLPSISDTGIMSPEMHIFSQVLNVTAAFGIVVFVLRYKMIHSLVNAEDSERLKILSRINLTIGIIACFGLSVVGNFQDNTSAIVHLIGALMVFLLGNTYILMDAAVTKKMHPKYNGQAIFWLRLIIGSLGICTFFITVIGAAVANKNTLFSNKNQRLHWNGNDPGYVAHLVSTFGEWTMGFCFLCYFFTYIRDFGKFSLKLNVTMNVSHLDETPNRDSGNKYDDFQQSSSGNTDGGVLPSTDNGRSHNTPFPASERTSLLDSRPSEPSNA